MRLNPYDEAVATAFRESREIPRAGLLEWRDAVRRHLDPKPGMRLLDIGAGTGAFSAAFVAWYGIEVVAVEPSSAMRAHIPQSEMIEVLEGDAISIPLPDASVDGAWLSLVIHHVPDLAAAAREIRRVLRPGAPVLLRQGFPDGDLDGIEMIRWFPETARLVETYPTLVETCAVFEAAGFRRESAEKVCELLPGPLADLLAQIDALRTADTTLRNLTEDEFQRGKERLRRAVESGDTEPRTNRLDLVVLR